MAKLYNLARMTTATTGTGTITLDTASSGFLTFDLAGVSTGETIAYGIKDGANSEVGTGTYTTAGATLTRSVTKSTNSDSAISLSGTAEVYITARKEDVFNTADALTSPQVAAQSNMEAVASTTLAVTPARQHFHPGHPKAALIVSLTGSAQISGNISSVNTGTEVITWSAAHGLTSGTIIKPNGGTWPTGSTLNTLYYINVPSTTTFTLHTTYADAIAGTNLVNLTAAGSGTRTLHTVTINTPHSVGITSVYPSAATADYIYTITNSSALSAITAGKWIGSLEMSTAGSLLMSAPATTTTVASSNAGGGGLPNASATNTSCLYLLFGDLA